MFSARVKYQKDLEEYYWLVCKTAPKAAITCPKLTLETLEQGVKYVQSLQ